jgi:hypothetical protein
VRQSNALPVALLGALVACSSKSRQRGEIPPPAIVPWKANSTAAPIPPVALSGPAAAPPVAPARNPEAPTSADAEPREALSAACYAGFRPGASPRVDVVRLGVSCGPSGGLAQLARLHGVVDEAGSPVTLRWHAERGDCFRLFAVAAEPAEDLEAEVLGPHGVRVSLTNQNRRWVVVDEKEPFCAAQEGQFEGRFTTHAGRAEVAVAVYRGARMVGKRHSG